MKTHKMKFRRFAILGMLIVFAGVIAVLFGASHASSANPLPAALAAADAQLSSVDDIHLSSLPAGTTLQVSQVAAETTALREFGKPLDTQVSAYAVLDTDNAMGTPQPDGSIHLEISNRPVWVVLIPDQAVQANPGPGRGGPPPPIFTATLAVFVDANTGDYLMASTFYP